MLRLDLKDRRIYSGRNSFYCIIWCNTPLWITSNGESLFFFFLKYTYRLSPSSHGPFSRPNGCLTGLYFPTLYDKHWFTVQVQISNLTVDSHVRRLHPSPETLNGMTSCSTFHLSTRTLANQVAARQQVLANEIVPRRVYDSLYPSMIRSHITGTWRKKIHVPTTLSTSVCPE